MQHTMVRLNSARRSAWLVGAFVAAASAWIVSTAFAGAWHDDFEGGGLEDWVIYNFDPGAESWDEEDGFVVGEIDQPGFISLLQLKPRQPAGVDTDDWQNYTVKVKMRLESEPEDGQNTSFGLMLYDHIEQDTFHWIFLEYHQARVRMHIRIGNAGGDDFFPFNVEQGVWYDVTATIETLDDSERVTFQVDDNPPFMTEWNGQAISGSVALIVGGGRVSFDDFVIEGDSIPNGGNGLPRSVSPAGLAAQLWGDLKSR